MKRTILASVNVLMTTYISQGSAATDLRGGDSFNSNFIHRIYEFNGEKKFMKIGPTLSRL